MKVTANYVSRSKRQIFSKVSIFPLAGFPGNRKSLKTPNNRLYPAFQDGFLSKFVSDLIHSELSPSIDSCLHRSSLNLNDTGSRQTERKVRVHLGPR